MDRIETARMILRPFRETDAADVYDYAKDPRVGPAAGWPPHRGEAESLEIIRTVFAAPGVAAIELKGTGRVIGSVGFTDIHYGVLEQPDDEIGYALHPEYWGRGLIPEAVRAILEYGFTAMGLQTIWCCHYQENLKSQRVIEKCGFRYRYCAQADVELLHEKRMCLHYALTKEEWKRGILSGAL